MRAEYYADLYRKYVTFMSNVSNTKIFRIAAGPYGDLFSWTETLMKNIPLELLDGIGVHHYSVIDWNAKGPSTEFTEKDYFITIRQTYILDEYLKTHAKIMDKYDPQKKVALIVDEWGGWYDVEPGTNPAFLYQQNTMRDAVLAGIALNIFNNHCERVRMANLAQTVNVLQAVILTDKEKIILTPTYHVMEMYNVHHDAVMLPITVQTDSYVVGDEKVDAVSCSASKDKSGSIHVSLVNVDINRPHEVNLDLQGVKVNSIKGRILTSEKVQDHNTFDNPDKISPKTFNTFLQNENNLKVTIPPFSVVVLEIK